jgi:hypothetical protein
MDETQKWIKVWSISQVSEEQVRQGVEEILDSTYRYIAMWFVVWLYIWSDGYDRWEELALDMCV